MTGILNSSLIPAGISRPSLSFTARRARPAHSSSLKLINSRSLLLLPESSAFLQNLALSLCLSTSCSWRAPDSSEMMGGEGKRRGKQPPKFKFLHRAQGNHLWTYRWHAKWSASKTSTGNREGPQHEDIKKSYAIYKNMRKVLWHGKIPSKIRSYEVMAPMRITGRDHDWNPSSQQQKHKRTDRK